MSKQVVLEFPVELPEGDTLDKKTLKKGITLVIGHIIKKH